MTGSTNHVAIKKSTMTAEVSLNVLMVILYTTKPHIVIKVADITDGKGSSC